MASLTKKVTKVKNTAAKANMLEFKEFRDASLLDNHLIRDRVLSYVTVRDLKSCRLVQSTWHAEATRLLKRKSVVKITKEFIEKSNSVAVLEEIRRFRPHNCFIDVFEVDRSHYVKIHKFLEDIGENLKYLKLRYALALGQPQILTLVSNVLNCHLPNLLHLSLVVERETKRFRGNLWYRIPGPNAPDGLFYPYAPHFAVWLDPLSPAIPSIKRIDLDVNLCSSEMMPENFRYWVNGVANLAPNLETFKMKKCSLDWILEDVDDEPTTLVINRCLSDQREGFRHVRNLTLTKISNDGIVALLAQNIKFRVLKLPNIDHKGVSFGFSHLEDLLEKHSDTLEVLGLGFRDGYIYRGGIPGTVPATLTLPSFPKLKTFKFVDGHESNYFVFSMIHNRKLWVEPVDYELQFPVLEKLIVLPGNEKNLNNSAWSTYQVYEAFFPNNGQVCHSLKVLNVPYPKEIEAIPENEHLLGLNSRLDTMFPNLFKSALHSGTVETPPVSTSVLDTLSPVTRITRSKSKANRSSILK